MKYVQRLSDSVYAIERILGIILMVIMLGAIAAGVFFRYFLKSPLTWSDELAIFMLVWVTFIGGSMSIKRQQAAAVTLLYDRLSPMIRKMILIVGFALTTIFSLYVAYLSFNWIMAPSVSMQMSPSLGITKFYVYLAIPVGFFCMGIHFFNFCLQSFSPINKVEE